MRRLISTLAVALLCASLAPTSAAAEGASLSPQQAQALLSKQATSQTELQQQVRTQLKLYPGGVQTAHNEISYNEGRFVITFAEPRNTTDARTVGILGSPDCPSGWFCFYDNLNYGYPRGKLSDCGAQDLSPYNWGDRTESMHNNTSSEVSYWNHIGAFHGYFSIEPPDDPVSYLDPGSYENTNSEDRNKVDHVLRLC